MGATNTINNLNTDGNNKRSDNVPFYVMGGIFTAIGLFLTVAFWHTKGYIGPLAFTIFSSYTGLSPLIWNAVTSLVVKIHTFDDDILKNQEKSKVNKMCDARRRKVMMFCQKYWTLLVMGVVTTQLAIIIVGIVFMLNGEDGERAVLGFLITLFTSTCGFQITCILAQPCFVKLTTFFEVSSTNANKASVSVVDVKHVGDVSEKCAAVKALPPSEVIDVGEFENSNEGCQSDHQPTGGRKNVASEGHGTPPSYKAAAAAPSYEAAAATPSYEAAAATPSYEAAAAAPSYEAAAAAPNYEAAAPAPNYETAMAAQDCNKL